MVRKAKPCGGLQRTEDAEAKSARLRNVGVVVVNHEVFDPRSEELMLPDITPQPGEIGAVIYLAVISLRADVGGVCHEEPITGGGEEGWFLRSGGRRLLEPGN